MRYLEDVKTGAATPPKKTATAQPPETRKDQARLPSRPSPLPRSPSYTDVGISEERREAARREVVYKQATPHSYYTQDCELPSEISRESK